MCSCAIKEPCSVEKPDSCRGAGKLENKLSAVAPLFESRPQAPQHQDLPEHQTDKEQNLPKSDKINIFIPLVAKPKAVFEAQYLLYREPLASQGPCDHHQ